MKHISKALFGQFMKYFSGAGRFVDSSHPVGVVDCFTGPNHIPFRVFYPGREEHNDKINVGWFVRSFSDFVEGYMHFIFPKGRTSVLLDWLISIVGILLSFLVPMASAVLPVCLHNAPVSANTTNSGEYPLIVYSHGLTGSGEEHALMFASWAQQGYVVACIHHCDGSSSRTPQKDGSFVYYEHADMKNYDVTFRPKQGIIVSCGFTWILSVYVCCLCPYILLFGL